MDCSAFSLNWAFWVSTTSLTSTHLSCHPYICRISSGLESRMSGTTPLVIAEMIFCRSGAKGMMLSSILLPLAFSYSATAFRSATSSSWTNACANHTLAVVTAALAMWGAARRRVAPRAADPRSTERLVRRAMVVSSPARRLLAVANTHPWDGPGQTLRARETKELLGFGVHRHAPAVKGKMTDRRLESPFGYKNAGGGGPRVLPPPQFSGCRRCVRVCRSRAGTTLPGQPVEALSVQAQHLAARILGQRGQPILQLADDAERGVDVWVVGRPDEVVGAEVLDHLRGDRLVRVRGDQALAVEISARVHADRCLVRRDPVLVIEPVEPGRDPVGAGLQHRAPEPRVALEHAGGKHLREGGHDVDGQEGDAEQGIGGIATLPLPEPLAIAHDHVEGDRHLQLLRRLPEPREGGIVEVSAAAGRQVRREEDADAPVAPGADRLLHGALGIEERDVGDRVEPPGVGAAELRQPAVVGARVGRGQRAVGDVPFPADADRGIEQHGVDPLAVHHAQPLDGIVAAGRAALGVGHLPPGEEPRGVHPDPAERAE